MKKRFNLSMAKRVECEMYCRLAVGTTKVFAMNTLGLLILKLKLKWRGGWPISLMHSFKIVDLKSDNKFP